MASRPLSSIVMAVSPWNTQPCPVLSVFGGLQRRKTTNFPVSPQDATLGVAHRVVNMFQGRNSSSRSMTCDQLQRLVQALSTSRCLVSNFENRSLGAEAN